MRGYTKLFQSIITSTVWQESNDAKALWVTMLALKDSDQVCRATVPALAKLNNLTIEEAEAILTKFEQPDPYSRSSEFEGRRIERCDQGWLILNGQKYQERIVQDERREYKRLKAQEYREKNRRQRVDKRGQTWTRVDEVDTQDPYKTNTRQKKEENKVAFAKRPFSRFWETYPKRNGRKAGKAKAEKVWKSLKLEDQDKALEALTAQLDNFRKCRQQGVFVAEFPDAFRWLRDRRFEDEVGEIERQESDWDAYVRQCREEEKPSEQRTI